MRGSWLSTVSVGRRIAVLVIAEVLTVALAVAAIARAFALDAADFEYSQRFTIAPAEALPEVLDQLASVRARLDVANGRAGAVPVIQLERALDGVDAFTRRYRKDWMTAGTYGPDALRFRQDLADAGMLSLLDDERRAVSAIEERSAALRNELPHLAGPEDLRGARDGLLDLKQTIRTLLAVDVRFVAIDHAAHRARSARSLRWLVGSGAFTLIVTVALGFYVQRAIGPRLARMARKVRTFQETGDFTRTENPGRDEIAVLSNALDAGFSAIRERDRERERFLAVAAHELKTPLTSISGFADAAVASPDDAALRTRALEVIARQARRLRRLVHDLFLAASARQQKLAFHPKAIEVRALVERIIREVEPEHARVELAAGGPVFLLADEELLSHVLWQMLSFALATTGPKPGRILVRLERGAAAARIEISIGGAHVTKDDLDRAFTPFASVQYEDAGLRYAFGLYLSCEIAKLHGGALAAQLCPDGDVVLGLELPA